MTDKAPTVIAGVDLDRVRAAIAPVLSAHGVSLVDVEYTTEHLGWTLRIFIERYDPTVAADAAAPGAGDPSAAQGGVTLDDCANVSRDVSTALDIADLIPHKYSLEVSSPGLDRPLRTKADFTRFVGKLARVKLTRPAPDGQRLLRGILEQAAEGSVAVLVDGKHIEVPFEQVANANLIFELIPGQKSKGGARKTSTKPSAKRPPKKTTENR